MKALYQNDNHFYNRPKVLENTMAHLATATITNPQSLKPDQIEMMMTKTYQMKI